MPSTRIDYCAHPDCLDAGRKVLIKGRGLCRKCYNRGFRQGWLSEWTAQGALRREVEGPDDQAPEAAPSPTLSHGDGSAGGPVRPAAQASRPAALRPPRKPVKKPVDLRVNVDFGAAAHVLEEIRVRADREMRPLALQILWELKRALAGEDAA